MPSPRFPLNTAQLHWRFARSRFARAGLKQRTFEGRCGRINYWEGGDGPPMVLLHGFGGDAIIQWHPQVAALSRKRRLIVPDLMFFGASTSGSPERGLDFQARAVLELAGGLGLPAFDLAGISYGGIVAYTLAGVFAERVRRLILIDSPGSAMVREDYWDLLLRFNVGSVAELLLPADGEGVKRLMRVAWVEPPWIPEFALEDARRFLFMKQLDAQRELLASLERILQSPPDPFPIHQPTLLVWGREDAIFPVEIGVRLQAQIGQNARLCVIEGAAHAPNQEKVREFNRAVTRFLNEPIEEVVRSGRNVSFG